MAGEPKSGIVGGAAKWLGLQIASQAVKWAVGSSIATSAMMGVLAYFQGFPLAWGFFSVVGTAAFTAMLLNQTRAFLVAYNVAGKVRRGDLIFRPGASPDGSVKGYALGFALHNAADIPLEYEVVRTHGDVGGMLAQQDGTKKRGAVLDAHGAGGYMLGVAPGDFIVDSNVWGNLDLEVHYGRPGKLKHTLKERIRFVALTDIQGNPIAINCYLED